MRKQIIEKKLQTAFAGTPRDLCIRRTIREGAHSDAP